MTRKGGRRGERERETDKKQSETEEKEDEERKVGRRGAEFSKKNPSMMLVCENGACRAVYSPPDCCSSCWYFNGPLSL